MPGCDCMGIYREAYEKLDLQGKKVLVFGAGISGIGSCGLLEKEGAEVILYDGNDKKDAEAMKAQLGEGSKVRVILGAFPEEEMESLDLVVMSPGVPTDLSVVLAMKEKRNSCLGRD